MKKKNIIVIIILILLFLGGFFLFKNNQNTPPEKWSSAEIITRKDYEIKETPEGKFVQNKITRVSFKIFPDWIIPNDPYIERSFYMYSPDIKFNQENGNLDKGCEIGITTSYIKTDAKTLEKLLSKEFNVEIENIKNIAYISYFLDLKDYQLFYAIKNLPIKNNLYTINLRAATIDKDFCQLKFDEFVKTINY